MGVALCVAYILGLLLSGLTIGSFQVGTAAVSGIGPIVCLLLPALVAISPPNWRLGLKIRDGCCLGLVVLIATVYIAVRLPQPGSNDVSRYVERAQAIAAAHIVTGQVLDEPKLNRGLKGRFRLGVQQLQVNDVEGRATFRIPVAGKLYVTAPLLQITGLHAGQWVTATGALYRPQAALNPGGFDFQKYLASQGTFAGLVAETLSFTDVSGWGLWQVRQRIVRTQLQALGSPLGQLVSAMVLGRQAVDLPADIQDLFSQVGLAHTIAASGFHVSLLLGTVLVLMGSQSGQMKLGVGLLVLGGYVILTGLQASVVRAVLMGAAALLGLALDRKVKPLGALLVAVTGMLLANPHWIWDIGFQLSVMATLGLIVMVPRLARQLDWLPVTLSALIAVPLAATLWTLPLTLYHFNVISGPSIALNALTTPLITVISLGGMGSSALALPLPEVAKFVASLNFYPTQLLLWLARMSRQLPGSAIATGQISILQLLGLYGALLLSVTWSGEQRLKKLWPACFLGLLLLPMGWRLLTQYQITILAAKDELIWVMQDHGRTTLINSGSEKTAFYTVQPFLRQAGINRITDAIALPTAADYPAGWHTLSRQTPIRHLYGRDHSPLDAVGRSSHHALSTGQSISINTLTVQSLGTENPILRLAAEHQSWLLLPPLSPRLQAHLAQAGPLLQSQILVWDGGELDATLLAAIHPQVAICYGQNLPTFIERSLQQSGVEVHSTLREGAITWTRAMGFHAYRAVPNRYGLL